MEFMANPPTLGGCIALAVLFGWALGRLQGAAGLGAGLGGDLAGNLSGDPRGRQRSDDRAEREQPVTASPTGVPLAAAGCPQQLHSALLTALASPDVLSDLHDEVSAFRRRERVFATLSPDLLQPAPMADEAARVCLRSRVIGHPLCGHPVCDGAGCRRVRHPCEAHGIAGEAAPMLRAYDVNPRRARQP